MHVPLSSLPPGTVIYPESDGEPMADNTRQLDWILKLVGNLKALFADRPDVFVAGNQNWYPVEGDPSVVAAPDAYVVFGRPKGDRGSYKQWEENNVPMTVVFEVLSPRNDAWEMADKLAFYDEYGVEEYYLYDPDKNTLAVYLRQGTAFRRLRSVDGFVSPRLGIRFQMTQPEMTVLYPDGRRFLPFEELAAARRLAEERASDAEQRASNAEERASNAEQRATLAETQNTGLRQRMTRLTELSRKARQGQASPEELQELERLESETS
jgi:Uma2 family endonuclease